MYETMEQEKKSALIISNIKKCLHGMEGLQLEVTNVITLRWTCTFGTETNCLWLKDACFVEREKRKWL